MKRPSSVSSPVAPRPQRSASIGGLAPARRLALGLAGIALSTAPAAAQLPPPASGALMFDGSGWRPGDTAATLAVDLNADGYPDLVTASSAIRTALNNGHVVFRAVGEIEDIELVYDLTSGDMDGDGHMDVVSCGASGSGHVAVFLGDGAGQLALADTHTVSEATTLALADFDLDGMLDVVAGHDATGFSFSTLRGMGAGMLDSPVEQGSQGFFAGVDAGDWDADGLPDVYGGSVTTARIFRGDGALGFTTYLSSTAKPGDHVLLSDIDGNGSLEGLNTHYASGIAALITRWDGIDFMLPSSKPYEAGGQLTVERDPADGFPDIAVAGAGTVTLFRNLFGNPTKQPAFTSSQGTSSTAFQALQLADFNGNGQPDVLVSSSGAQAATVYLADAQGDVPSVGVVDFPTGVIDVHTLASADFNNDARPDFVSADGALELLYVSLGVEGSMIGPWTTQPTRFGARDIELADLDQSGSLDVVLMCVGSQDRFAAHLGDGSGDFGPVIGTSFNAQPQEFEAGDLDGDGAPDLVLLHDAASDSQIRTWLGNGDGTFAYTELESIGSYGRGMGVGDVDLDGTLDVVATRNGPDVPGGSQLLLLHGLGTGSLAAPVLLPQPLSVSGRVQVVDFDQDGFDDVITSTGGAARLAVFRNDGAGSLLAPRIGGMPSGSVGPMHIADIDGDGHLDIVHNTSLEALVVVTRGDGAGGLHDVTAHPARRGGNLSDVVSADVDLDGMTDLVQLSSYDRQLAVLLSKGPAVDAWASIGGGTPGALGQPRAQGTGQASPGQPTGVDVTRAAPSAPATVVLGLSLLDLPFKGGRLVPNPDVLLDGVVTDGGGQLSLAGAWPAGVPSGAELWLQVWIADGAAAAGLAATGGLRLVVP